MSNPLNHRKPTPEENLLVQSRLRVLRNERPFLCEFAGTIEGVHFINDSAATTIEGVSETLAGFEKPVVWIAEANGKHGDFSLLNDLVKHKVKAVIGVGEYAHEIHENLWSSLSFFASAGSWDEALDLSLIMASKDETVLFSPGAGAGEPFENYRERGTFFNRLIRIRNH